MSHDWTRVTRQFPCPICEKPDWCAVCRDLNLVLCMRIVSTRPSKNEMGGYLHTLDGAVAQPEKREKPLPTQIDGSSMMKKWFRETTREQYEQHADELGVHAGALIALKCAWAKEHGAWAFPMRNGAGLVVGIRLRATNGRKWSVRGGHEGVFQPSIDPQEVVFCAEGPTDTAALLSIGKYAIGRPSCSGGVAILSAVISRLGIRKAVIVADNEADKQTPNGQRWNPGCDGAQKLSDDIGVPCCIVVLPVKDCREAVRCGMTEIVLDALVKSLVWKLPRGRRGDGLPVSGSRQLQGAST